MPSILNFEIKDKKQEEVYEESSVADIPIPEVNAEDFTDDEPEPEIIDFVKKPEIVEEEIFSNAPVRKKKGQPTRSTSPKKTKRKPMSDEDKAKRREALARGRETRMRNLAKKKQEQQTEKELSLNKRPPTPHKKQPQSPPPPPEPEPERVREPQPMMRQSITQEDIERSQMNTLMAYEKMRKQRKAEKKKVKQIEEQQQQIKQTIQQVSAPAWGSQRHRGKYGGMLRDMGL